MGKMALRLTEDGWPMVEPLPQKQAILLKSTMTTDEEIFGQIVGLYGQTAVATTKRVLILKSGFMVGSTFGSKSTSFDYRNITAVEIRTSLATGYFELTAGGMTLPNVTGIGNKQRQQELPNVITFDKSSRANWDRFAGKVRDMTHAMHTSPILAVPSPAELPIPAKIAQLAELHKSGLLTDDEFSAKKTELLSRI